MSGVKNRDSRSFIHPARLHTDETILNQVDTTNAMRTANLVKFFEQRYCV